MPRSSNSDVTPWSSFFPCPCPETGAQSVPCCALLYFAVGALQTTCAETFAAAPGQAMMASAPAVLQTSNVEAEALYSPATRHSQVTHQPAMPRGAVWRSHQCSFSWDRLVDLYKWSLGRSQHCSSLWVRPVGLNGWNPAHGHQCSSLWISTMDLNRWSLG